MGAEVHLLSKKFIKEEEIVSSLERTAKQQQVRFYKEHNHYGAIMPTNPGDELGDQLDIFINNFKEYQETLDLLYYPDIPDYGAIIIISCYDNDKLLVPFLKGFLSDFSEIKVYADRNNSLPEGVEYHLFSKIDFDLATTTDTFTFLRTPPMENGNTVV